MQNLIKEAVRDELKNNGINILGKPKELLTAKEAASLLGCSRSFLYTQKFPHKKLGKRIFFQRKEIEDFIKNGNAEDKT